MTLGETERGEGDKNDSLEDRKKQKLFWRQRVKETETDFGEREKNQNDQLVRERKKMNFERESKRKSK